MKLSNATVTRPDHAGQGWNACVLTALALAAATAVRAALTPLWGSGYTFITYYPAIMFSASLGGWRLGLFATFASAFLCYTIFLPMNQLGMQQGMALGLFVGANVLVTFLIDRIRRGGADAVARAIGLTTRVEERKQSEAALRESEERYRALYAALPVAAFVCDRNGVIQNYNSRAVELWGREPKIGVERHCGSVKLILPDGTLLPHAQSPMMEVLRTGTACRNVEVLIERPDGSRIPVIVNFCALRDAQGAITGVVTSFDDITAHKRTVEENEAMMLTALRQQEKLRESENRKSAILDAALDAIISMDHQGKVADFNPAAEEIFGHRREDVLGRTLAELIIPERLRERHYRGLARYLETGEGPVLGQRLEMPALHADGHEFSIELAISPIPGLQPPMFTATLRDITERKRAEEALRQAKDELARQAAELERQVNERTASLQETIAQLEEFSYSVSHDLRAPLRAMQGYASAVLQDYGDQIGEEGKGYLQRIISGGLRMDRLTRDVLAYSKVARGPIAPEPVFLDKLVGEVIQHYLQLQPLRAEISVERPLLPVLGQESWLTQAISNLLTNAVKFVPEGRTPRVRVRTERRDGHVRLWVEDNGIGIKPEYQARLFGMFERLHVDHQYEGTGIGLAIVRKSIERMGGTVGLESDGETGSKFWIQLPAPQEKSQPQMK